MPPACGKPRFREMHFMVRDCAHFIKQKQKEFVNTIRFGPKLKRNKGYEFEIS